MASVSSSDLSIRQRIELIGQVTETGNLSSAGTVVSLTKNLPQACQAAIKKILEDSTISQKIKVKQIRQIAKNVEKFSGAQRVFSAIDLMIEIASFLPPNKKTCSAASTCKNFAHALSRKKGIAPAFSEQLSFKKALYWTEMVRYQQAGISLPQIFQSCSSLVSLDLYIPALLSNLDFKKSLKNRSIHTLSWEEKIDYMLANGIIRRVGDDPAIQNIEEEVSSVEMNPTTCLGLSRSQRPLLLNTVSSSLNFVNLQELRLRGGNSLTDSRLHNFMKPCKMLTRFYLEDSHSLSNQAIVQFILGLPNLVRCQIDNCPSFTGVGLSVQKLSPKLEFIAVIRCPEITKDTEIDGFWTGDDPWVPTHILFFRIRAKAMF